nr:ABC transporter ATP-binding protein [Geobacteraceae bacterium]
MTVLRFEEVSFSYRSEPFVRNLSFDLCPGQLTGVIGANGSGKSTILRLGAGLLSPRSGMVKLLGQPIGSLRGRERAARLGYLPQSVEASLPFRVGELVAMGAAAGGTGEAVCREALRCVGLSGRDDTLLSCLSGGERRRAFIAMVLAQGGSVLLLDEPLAGLDLRFQYELLDLLRDMCRERQVAILLSLHDLALARELDRLLVV